MSTVSDRLKWLREEKYGKRGMSKFAKQLGITPGGLLNYERGHRQVPSNVLLQVARCTAVNLHWLLTGEGVPYPNPDTSQPTKFNIRETVGNRLAGDFSPKEEIAVEGVHHQKFLTDYWPALKPWAETERIHLWLIDKQQQPPSAVEGFENRVVYLNRSSRKDRRIIKNLLVDTVICSLPDFTETDIFTDWVSQERPIFLELTASKGLAGFDYFKGRKQPSSALVQLVNPYWMRAYPFYQNADCLLERIGGKIKHADIVFFSSDGWEDSLLHAFCLLALVGDLNSVEVQSVNVPPAVGRENTKVEILLSLTTYLKTRADVSIQIGESGNHEVEQYLQLEGESADTPTLRIDFEQEEISFIGKNQPPTYLMPMLTYPYRFLLNQVISGHYPQNPCGLSWQSGMEILGLYFHAYAQIQSQLQPGATLKDHTIVKDNLTSVQQEAPLFQSVPTLVHSLPLTQSDQDWLINRIGEQQAHLNRFESVLYPAVVKGFDAFIETAMIGGIGNIPQLIKHCLTRATLCTTGAMLVPEIVLHLAQKDIQLALDYARLIPDPLLNDKLNAYESVMERLLERGQTASALSIVEEALAAVYRQDDLFERMKALLSIARFYAHCGDISQADQMLAEATGLLNPDSAVQEQVVRFYRQVSELEVEMGDLNRAERTLNRAAVLGKERLTDSRSFNIHLSRCSVRYARLGLKWMGQRNTTKAETLINQATQFIEQMTDPFHQVEALLEGIRHYYKHLDNPVQAHAVLLRTIDIANSISDQAKQSLAFSRIIGDVKQNDSEIGLEEGLVHQISDPMLAASASLSIAFAYHMNNRQEQAKAFLERAIRLAENAKSIQGRTEILYRVAMKFIQNHDIQAALRLAQRSAVSEASRVVLLLRLIRALAEKGEVDSARQKREPLIERVQQLPGHADRLKALVQIALMDWMIGEQESGSAGASPSQWIVGAQNLLPELTTPIEKMAALLEFAEFHTQSGDGQKASQYLAEAETLVKPVLTEVERAIRLPSDALSLVAGVWAKTYPPDKALELVQQTIQAPALKTQAIAQLAITFAQAGDLENALELTPQVKDTLHKATLLAHIASGFAERGNQAKAKETLDEAIQLANQITLSSNQANACAAIAQASAKMGDSSQALRFLQKALQTVSQSTRETAIEVIGHLIPVMDDLGGSQLLSDVYTELQRADEIFND